MTGNRRAPFLQVVRPGQSQPAVHADDFAPSSWQSTLFAESNPKLLAFLRLDQIEEKDLLTVLIGAKLKCAIDLRIAPRFDVGNLNRKLVFGLFEQTGTQYIDVCGQLGITDRRDARLNPLLLSEFVAKQLPATIDKGPVGLIVDAEQFEDSYIHAFSDGLAATTFVWDILKVPYPQTPQVSEKASGDTYRNRSSIFISHANPENNDFAIWLGTQLTLAGYEVWSDVTKLIGGEEFWDDIEDTIRNRAAKVIVVVSNVSQSKKGVLDEVNCAISVERAEARAGFVLPVRLDDIPFSNFRANLARKNVIDFNANWAGGLDKLISALEKDAVPKVRRRSGPIDVSRWSADRIVQTQKVQTLPEPVVTNWFRLTRLPDVVHMYHLGVQGNLVEDIRRGMACPTFPYFRLIGSFADISAVEANVSPVSVKEEYTVHYDKFIGGRPEQLPGMDAREARNFVLSMLRVGWDQFAHSQNMLSFQTASKANAWYFPKGGIDNDTAVFVDRYGKRRRKKIVGWSEKRKVFWHFAIEMKPVLGRTPRMLARPHVIFSVDGRTPLDNADKMHALRRGFCRSWWNDRWRDLLLAYFTTIGTNGEITVPMGGGANYVLSASPVEFLVPVSVIGEETSTQEDESVDQVPDDDIEEYEIFEEFGVADLGEEADDE